MRAFMILVLAATLGACAPDAPEVEEPSLEEEATAASLVLVAACRAQGEQCAARAREHPCQFADDSCMTPAECTAWTLACMADALNQ